MSSAALKNWNVNFRIFKSKQKVTIIVFFFPLHKLQYWVTNSIILYRRLLATSEVLCMCVVDVCQWVFSVYIDLYITTNNNIFFSSFPIFTWNWFNAVRDQDSDMYESIKFKFDAGKTRWLMARRVNAHALTGKVNCDPGNSFCGLMQ